MSAVNWNEIAVRFKDLSDLFGSTLSQIVHVLQTVGLLSWVISQQAEVAQGVPGRLKFRIFLTFGTTRVVGRQP